MNKLLKGGTRLLHNRLDGIITRWNAITVQQLPEPPYNSLAPMDDADAVYYIEALNWALERGLYPSAAKTNFWLTIWKINAGFPNRSKKMMVSD